MPRSPPDARPLAETEPRGRRRRPSPQATGSRNPVGARASVPSGAGADAGVTGPRGCARTGLGRTARPICSGRRSRDDSTGVSVTSPFLPYYQVAAWPGVEQPRISGCGQLPGNRPVEPSTRALLGGPPWGRPRELSSEAVPGVPSTQAVRRPGTAKRGTPWDPPSSSLPEGPGLRQRLSSPCGQHPEPGPRTARRTGPPGPDPAGGGRVKPGRGQAQPPSSQMSAREVDTFRSSYQT